MVADASFSQLQARGRRAVAHMLLAPGHTTIGRYDKRHQIEDRRGYIDEVTLVTLQLQWLAAAMQVLQLFLISAPTMRESDNPPQAPSIMRYLYLCLCLHECPSLVASVPS